MRIFSDISCDALSQMCDPRRSVISIALPIVLAFGVGVIVSCYFWANARGDLPDEPYPYISDTGNQPPQQWLFAFGFGIVALFMIVATVFRFLQFQWEVGKWTDAEFVNGFMLCFGCVGFVCMILLASLNDLDFRLAHNINSAVCFGCLFVYQLLHTALVAMIYVERGRIRARNDGMEESIDQLGTTGKPFQPSNLYMIIYYLLVNALSITSIVLTASHFLPFDSGLPQVAESVSVFATLAYYLPWTVELQNCTVENLYKSRNKHDVDMEHALALTRAQTLDVDL